MGTEVHVWSKLRHLVPAPPLMVAVYGAGNNGYEWVERVPVLYVGIEDRLHYRGRHLGGLRPDRHQIIKEESVAVWLVEGLVADECVEEALLPADCRTRLFGFEYGGVHNDWTARLEKA